MGGGAPRGEGRRAAASAGAPAPSTAGAPLAPSAEPPRAATAPPGAGTHLEGILDRITYVNEENAWSVVKLAVRGRREPVTVIGNLLGVQPGESLRLAGRWELDRRWGEQFRAESYTTVAPATLVGIEKYLGSGLVRGLGRALARRLVARFGLATLEIIGREPERLREVPGIGPLRSARIAAAWEEQRQVRQVMVFLQTHGVSTTYAVKIYKRYRERAIALVRENPYRLALDIYGIGFKTADRIARQLGVPTDAPERAQAALLHLLGERANQGHVYFPRAELVAETAALLASAVEQPSAAGAATAGAGPVSTVETSAGEVRAGATIAGARGEPATGAGEPLGPAPEERGAAAALALDLAALRRRVDDAVLALATAGEVVVEALTPAGAATAVAPVAAVAASTASATSAAGDPLAPAEAVYLRSLALAESGTAERLRALAAIPVRPPAGLGGLGALGLAPLLDRALARFEAGAGLTLAPEQRRAIRAAATAKLLVVTGGPGTGKTTLIRGVLEAADALGRRVALAAPTGRAAKRMSEATGRSAKTLHRLLEFEPQAMRFARDRDHPLDADLVIVDEVSMLDQVLAYNLVKAIPPAGQLLLVGDVDQLPSVGPGSVLAEIIASGTAEVVRLSHIFRQGEASLIVVNAHRVNRGELPREAPRDTPTDFYWIAQEAPEEILATVERLVSERVPRRFGFDPVSDIQVLTPMHRGLLGAAHLNAELQRLLNPAGAELVHGGRLFRAGDKVLQIRNDYDRDVFNGDLGRIVALDAVDQQLTVDFDGRRVVYEPADLDELVLAYACSIHKAQGSEYPCVVVPLHTQHYQLLQRNLLYTALTRGKRLVVLVGSRRAVAIAVKNARLAPRCTRLAERLRGTSFRA